MSTVRNPAQIPVNEVQTRRSGFVWLLVVFCVLCMVGHTVSAGSVVVTDETGERRELYSNSYALLIGVSDYTNGWEDLDQVPSELDKARQALEAHGFGVTMVTEETSMRQLKIEIDDFIRQYGHNENNRLVFIYSGHGHTWSAGNQGYLVPSDAPVPETEDGNPGETFRANTLHISQMMEWARQMTARHVLFLFDSCFSGMVFKTRGKEPVARRKSFKWKTNSQPSRQFITAGSAHELVPARSVFMPAFINAITTDEADYSEDGYLTGEELGIYLETVVPRYADQTPQYGTHPSWELSRGNFVFVLDELNVGEKAVTDVPADAAPVDDTPDQSQQLAKVTLNDRQLEEVVRESAPDKQAESKNQEKTLSLLQQLKLRQDEKNKKREEEERLQAKNQALEKLAQEKRAQEELEKEKLAQEKLEQEELAQEKLALEKLEQEKLQQEKLAQEELAQEKLAQEKLEQEKLEQEKLEQEELEQEKLAQEELAQEELAQEELEQERLEQAKLAQDELNLENLAKKNPVPEKLEQDEPAKEELAKENLDREKLAQEKQSQEKLAELKLAQEKQSQEKLAELKLAQETQSQEKLAELKFAEEKQSQEKLAQERRARTQLALEQQAQRALEKAALDTTELKEPESDVAESTVMVAAVDTAPARKPSTESCAKVTPDRSDYFEESQLSVAQQGFSVFLQPNHACKSNSQISKGDGVVLLAKNNQWVHLRSKETGSTGWVHQQTLNTTLSEVDVRDTGQPLWKWIKGKVVSEESPEPEPVVQQIPEQPEEVVVAANEFSGAQAEVSDCEVVSPGSADYHSTPRQYTTVSSVKMFQKPDSQCQMYLTVDKSQGVMVLARQGKWIHLRDMSSGKRGWVSAKALYSAGESQ